MPIGAFGSKYGAGFTPVELLLTAIGGCSAADVDIVTARRAEPDRFEVVVEAEKDSDDTGKILRDIRMTFHVTFPEGTDGDAARDRLPRAVQSSHDRSCTVSRSVEAASPVTVRIADTDARPVVQAICTSATSTSMQRATRCPAGNRRDR